MTTHQIEAVRKRVESLGFETSGIDPMKATKAGVNIQVSRAGLCSSNVDLSDIVAPIIPEILSFEPSKVSYSVLRRAYFASERRGGESIIRLSPRLESEQYWEGLRAEGACALTPDEGAVYSSVLASRASSTPMLTDFPTEDSSVRRIGRRQYYDSILSPRQACSTLRSIDRIRERKAYLPRDSIISLPEGPPPEDKMRRIFGHLGEWCFLALR